MAHNLRKALRFHAHGRRHNVVFGSPSAELAHTGLDGSHQRAAAKGVAAEFLTRDFYHNVQKAIVTDCHAREYA
ncbi:MAG TPA: hypothetical protein VGG02_05490 [Chthoniobacterales bacterium]|jgi:hypothetical protein